MASSYRLVISSPTSATNAAKNWEFAPGPDCKVLSIDVQLKREKREISYLTARVSDKDWTTFNALPDPAYADVPVKFYMARPDDVRNVPVLVFDGILTEMSPDFPSPQTLQLVAHDRSVKLRRQSTYRAFTKKTSTQIAQAIAKEYGLSVEVDAGDVTVTQVAYDIGAGDSMSDWDHLTRALAADGLECFVEGSKLKVRQKASLAYPTTFRRGEYPVLRFQPKILHVSSPGKGGSVKTAMDVVVRGVTIAGSIDSDALARAAVVGAMGQEDATRRTHMRPMARKAGDGAHSEDKGTPWSNQVDLKRRRKDTATLQLHARPDIGLHHTITIAGYGAKADGSWSIEAIKHVIVGANARTTDLSLTRGTSKGAAKQAGISNAIDVVNQ